VTFTLLNAANTVVGTPTAAAVTAGAVSVSYALPNATPAGSYKIQTSYNGNSNLGSSSGPTATFTINKKGTSTAESNAASDPCPTSCFQYSDRVNFAATVSPATVPGFQLGGSVQFTINGVSYGSATIDSGGRAVLPPQQVFLAPGTYTVVATFAPNAASGPDFTGSTGSSILTIVQEDARAYYTGALIASTGSSTSTVATVTLAATIKDITAVGSGDNAFDPYAGDIRNATVQFVNRDASNAVLCSAPIGLVSATDTTVGTATCNASLNASTTTGGSSYTIGMLVGGYYARNCSYEDQTVNVYIPQSNFITGGGYINNASSAGLYPGAAGQRTNFGFNVKYNKSGTNLQGNINVIVRNNGHTYQIKGNSMTSLAVQVCTASGCPSATSPSTATFNGKASIQDITDPNNPISIDGNATLQVTMHDYGSPGSNDTVGITVWNKAGGVWYASNWNGTSTVEQKLGGGDLSVH
jgi:hypothetical protein